MKLAGKTALVTGGAAGIGRAVAELFQSEGAQVAVFDRDREGGEAFAAQTGGLFIAGDVRSADDCRRALDETVARFGTPDILVNDAAWQLNKTLLETSDEEFQAVLDTNLVSTFRLTRETAKRMIAAGKGGAIVNFSSTFAIVGSPGYAAYHASKGGIAAFTRAAAIALMPYNIRVNAIAPGTTLTPGLHAGAADTGNHDRGMESFLKLQPLGRFGNPEEIARTVLFLASDDASFVYVANLVADGGYTII